MWLSNSSVGRKVVMSISGLALILFLTFHMAMNLVALFSPEGYNMVCEFLGANWYALVATLGLAALFVLHLVYAIILTVQNRKARGTERYAVIDKPKTVEWSSQNMFVLGVVVIAGLGLHLANFWYNMQFAELRGIHDAVANGGISPTDGAGFIRLTFSNPIFVVLYLIWLVSLWFHLTHGFWSALQTMGWSNDKWFRRWKNTSNIYTTIVVLCFALVVVWFYAESLLC